MASKDVVIKIKFDDNNAITSIEGLDKGLKGVKKTTEGVGASGGIGFGKLTASIFSAQVALQAFNKVLGFLGDSVQAVIKMENAMLGLSSVAKALTINTEFATNAAVRLSSDGLLSVAEASEGLKNLLGAGFGLPQATKLMLAFKDASAFNRQGMLGFGQAIVGATQGIKN